MRLSLEFWILISLRRKKSDKFSRKFQNGIRMVKKYCYRGDIKIFGVRDTYKDFSIYAQTQTKRYNKVKE